MANSALENPKNANPELKKALGDFRKSESQEDLKTVFYFLTKNFYLLASDYVGKENAPGMNQATQQSVSIRTAFNEHRQPVMMAFTDSDEMIVHCGAESRYLTVDANTLINMVVSQPFAGMVVNPGTEAFYLSKEELARALQAEQRPNSFRPSPIEPRELNNDPLRTAMVNLLQQPDEPSNVAFQQELWRSTLLLPMEHLGDNSMHVVGMTTPAGISGFAAFTDIVSAQLLGGNYQLLPFEFELVLAMAVQYPAEIFVLNPAGPEQLELEMAVMRQMFRLHQQTGQRGPAFLN